MVKIKNLVKKQVVFNDDLVSPFFHWDQAVNFVHEHNFGGYVHAFMACAEGPGSRDLANNSAHESFVVGAWSLILDVIRELLCRYIGNHP